MNQFIRRGQDQFAPSVISQFQAPSSVEKFIFKQHFCHIYWSYFTVDL